MNKDIIKLTNLVKDYNTLNKKIEVLKKINYSFDKGKFYAIKGHSGSGKSTLVKILGLMDNPTSGKYLLFNNEVPKLSDKLSSYYRMKHIGFIFQEYNLNPYLNAIENVIVPMLFNAEISKKERKEKAKELLKKVGLENRLTHFPSDLSGGEQQRVAIARSLANSPDILIADEPTGNLDKANEKIIFKLLKEMSNEGKCVIVVSHSDEVNLYSDICLELDNGKLKEVNHGK